MPVLNFEDTFSRIPAVPRPFDGLSISAILRYAAFVFAIRVAAAGVIIARFRLSRAGIVRALRRLILILFLLLRLLCLFLAGLRGAFAFTLITPFPLFQYIRFVYFKFLVLGHARLELRSYHFWVLAVPRPLDRLRFDAVLRCAVFVFTIIVASTARVIVARSTGKEWPHPCAQTLPPPPPLLLSLPLLPPLVSSLGPACLLRFSSSYAALVPSAGKSYISQTFRPRACPP
mmetsp:Transcript_39708/g.119328  ORF Transcript_39708/g.119328 Transcript_39708/m.119328 type:complete len:231 (+) Transcript_39708:479-1171(+)